MICALDGTFLPESEAKIPAFNRGLAYGDGLFETIRLYPQGMVGFSEHVNRLFSGMRILGMQQLYSEKELLEEIFTLRKVNILNDHAYLRIQIWRDGERGFAVSDDASIHKLLTVGNFKPSTSSRTMTVVSIPRIPSSALPSGFKWSNSINYILAAREAIKKNYDEALMCTLEGNISETTQANIFWKSQGTWFTPDLTCDILPGITRQYFMHFINDHGEEIKEGVFSIEQLQEAECVILTNSLKECQWVECLDEIQYSKKNRVKELQIDFHHYLKKHLVAW